MSDPLISVIVPVYKTERYLRRCVDSIRAQTHANLEIILVDDGSPDNSGALCEALAQEDRRIRVIHKKNGGLSSARNAGLDAAQGAYVCFVDSDDMIDKQMCQTLYERLVQQEADVSCCGIANFDGEKIVSYFNPNLEDSFTLLRDAAMKELSKNYRITNSMCDKLYRADIFDQLRLKEGILYEDAQVQHFCLHRAARITYTAQPLYYYFLSPGSILRGEFSTRHYDCITASQERIAFFEKHYPGAVAAAKARHLELCMQMVYQGKDNPQWDNLRKSLVRHVRSRVEKTTIREMGRNNIIKRMLLCISEPLFLWVMEHKEGQRKAS